MVHRDMTQGRRVYSNVEGVLRLAPGDYGRDQDGIWHAKPPQMEGQHPLSGSLAGHDVVEHEDGTITVMPSIEISYPWGDPPQEKRWHGHLERGIWRLAQ